MAEMTIPLQKDPTTGKKKNIVSLKSDEDAPPHEDARRTGIARTRGEEPLPRLAASLGERSPRLAAKRPEESPHGRDDHPSANGPNDGQEEHHRVAEVRRGRPAARTRAAAPRPRR